MREIFPHMEVGDYLSAAHVNRMSKACRRISGMYDGQLPALQPPVIRPVIVTGTSNLESSGTYDVQPRYWDSEEEEWATDTDGDYYDLDASQFGNNLAVGDVVVAHWDALRECFIGGKSEISRAVQGQAVDTVDVFAAQSNTHDPGNNLAEFRFADPLTEHVWGYFVHGMIIKEGVYLLIPYSDDFYYVADPSKIVLAKTGVGGIGSGSSGVCEIYSPITETALGLSVSVFNRGSSLPANQFVYIQYVEGRDAHTPTVDYGRWEVQGGGAGGSVVTGVAVGTAQDDKIAGETCDFDVDGDTVTATVADGFVFDGDEYHLVEFDSGWVVIDPEFGVTGAAVADYAVGATGSFTVASRTVSGEVILFPVETLDDIELQWSVDHWIALGTSEGSQNPNITGNCDTFFEAADGSGNFTTALGTISATISRGLCLAGKDYGLVWADGDHYAVVDPELIVVGKAGAVTTAGNSATMTVHSGTAGSESTTGETVSAYVRKGLVFTVPYYEIVWLDNGWKISSPATVFDATAAADIALDATPSQLIFAGSLGSESSTGVSVTVRNSWAPITSGMRVKVEWCDWPTGGGWEYVNARCPT